MSTVEGFTATTFCLQMETELGQPVTFRKVFAVFFPKKMCCHVRLFKLLLKMRKSFLEVLKALIAIGWISAIEPMVQLGVLNFKRPSTPNESSLAILR